MVALTSFITSLGTSAGLFLLLMVIFTILARIPANRFIYYPSRILSGRDTPDSAKKYRGPWVWMIEAYSATEKEIIAAAGLDAAIYLNVFSAALKIMMYSSIFLLPVLIPLAATDDSIKTTQEMNPNATYNTTELDKLAMSNISEQSPRIWAFLIGVYTVSIVMYTILNQTYRHVVTLRAEDMGDLSPEPEQMACIVRDIPKLPPDQTRTEQVDNFFRKAHPGTYEKCLIVTKLRKPSKLWKKLEKAKAKLAHEDAVFELSKTETQPEGIRPQKKTGIFGLYGPKVDSIHYWTQEIKDLSTLLERQQEDMKANDQKGAAIVIFNSRRAAAEASQESHTPFSDTWTVLPAPEPRAVIWKNLPIGFYSRVFREPIVYFIVFVTIVFYMIPITFIASLTTLDNVTKYVPFIKPLVKITALKTVIQAYLPQLALLLFLTLLPYYLTMLSKLEGIVSKADLERAACGKMYYFVVFNVFLGFTIVGTVFQSANALNELTAAGNFSFNEIIDLFGTSLPPNASYFITYVALKFFVGYGLELSRLIPLVMYHLKKRYMCKTEDELLAAWAPGSFTYLPDIPNDMLVVTITMAYAVIAPLIIPFAFSYFGIGWFVVRNQALNVYVPDYESRGRFWPHIHSRFLVGLFVSQITAVGYFGVKKFKYFFFLLPLPFITLWYARLTHKVYYPAFNHLSVSAASNEAQQTPTLDAIVDAFTPPCLVHQDLASELRHDSLKRVESSPFEDPESQVPSSYPSGSISPANHWEVDEQNSDAGHGNHRTHYDDHNSDDGNHRTRYDDHNSDFGNEKHRSDDY